MASGGSRVASEPGTSPALQVASLADVLNQVSWFEVDYVSSNAFLLIARLMNLDVLDRGDDRLRAAIWHLRPGAIHVFHSGISKISWREYGPYAPFECGCSLAAYG